MNDSGQTGEGGWLPIRPRTAAKVAGAAILAASPFVKTGGWAALSQILTLAYQFGAIALFGHHLLHVKERYYSIGLARATSCELGLLVLWIAVAVLLSDIPDPKLPHLTVCWLATAALLLLSATNMERARVSLKRKTGYRALRATDVIRESKIWLGLCSRFAQVEDEKIDEWRDRLSRRDTEDGKLSRTTWATWCCTMAIGLVAATGTLGSTLAPPEDPPVEEEVVVRPTPDGHGCSADYDPAIVPEPQRTALALAWHEVDGLEAGPMEALGYDIAGCPGPARPIPGLPGSWYAPGYCEGNLRGVAIALGGMDHPVYLLEQSAELALPLIRHGEFVSATDRFEVGGGDGYVIDSDHGSYVPVRDAVTAGPVDAEGQSGKTGCGKYNDRDVAYGVAGPGLIEAWKAVAAITPGGVYPIPYGTAENGQVRVALRSREVGIVAVAHCNRSLRECGAEIAGTAHRWDSGAYLTREEVRALVEP